MKTLLRFSLVTLLSIPLLAAVPAWANTAKTESFEDKVCPAIDEDGILQQQVLGLLRDRAHKVPEVVTELKIDRKQLVKNAVRYEIARVPDEVSDIVAAALEAGATTEDIAVQCDCSIPDDIVPDLVAAAILNNAEPDTMIRRCLRSVRNGSVYNVLVAALNSAQAADVYDILYAAIETFRLMGFDGNRQLIQALVETGKIDIPGIPGGSISSIDDGTGSSVSADTGGEAEGSGSAGWSRETETLFSELLGGTESSGNAEEVLAYAGDDSVFNGSNGGAGFDSDDAYTAAETIVDYLTNEQNQTSNEATVGEAQPLSYVGDPPEPAYSDS